MLDTETEKAAADFIRKAVVAGYSEDDIRKSFLAKNYPIDEVDRLIGAYIQKEIPAEHHYGRYVLFVAGILVIVLVVLFLLPNRKICDSQECFVNSAHRCKDAELRQLEEGSVFMYRIKEDSSNQCVLVKTAIDLDEHEPQEVQVLRGKSMECSFFKGTFNTNWINYLTEDLEGCYGELKDGLMVIAPETVESY